MRDRSCIHSNWRLHGSPHPLLWCHFFLQLPHSFDDLLTQWVELQGSLVGRQGLQEAKGIQQ